MVKFNPGLSQILNKVFLAQNMQLELTKDCWAFTQRYSNDNTKCYSKQNIGRINTKTEQNFNPGIALIGISETGPWSPIMLFAKQNLVESSHFKVTNTFQALQ